MWNLLLINNFIFQNSLNQTVLCWLLVMHPGLYMVESVGLKYGTLRTFNRKWNYCGSCKMTKTFDMHGQALGQVSPGS